PRRRPVGMAQPRGRVVGLRSHVLDDAAATNVGATCRQGDRLHPPDGGRDESRRCGAEARGSVERRGSTQSGSGLFEIGWAVGLKYTQGFSRLWPSIGTAVAMVVSVALLAWAMHTPPVG